MDLDKIYCLPHDMQILECCSYGQFELNCKGLTQLAKLRYKDVIISSHYVMITYFFAPICMVLLRSFLT